MKGKQNSKPSDLRKYLEKGVYLGYIEELDFSERFAVIQSPKLDKLFFLFSPELSLLDYKDVKPVYVKEASQPNPIEEMYKDSIVPDLKPGDSILFTIDGGLIQRIKDKKEQMKKVIFTSNFPNFLDGKLKYVPKALDAKEIVPYRDVVTFGQVVKAFDKYIVIDAGIYLFIELSSGNVTSWSWKTFKRKKANEKYKIGDWIKVEFGEISFIDFAK
ncbi:hypothetical protein A3D03_05590 [Candidatus Gottesmanbacteria bacterium RIFCSPHIGHO2_02_FULL_40_13]|uniref:Uncharacterized protein n=1 Tax=Candidatus Gottesmanbacteria bacterium RIFCSPHIGHO2_02_FULL_40_13 TaxID=1798384 RepID=A0A1F6A7L3_9BACT|nr:MAG: hypothetical protein A3D03_05590 [Candidatus Gottesmanbacteria bacterium RIFCSPHIGHO2_02_FULL_40_13]